MVNDEAYARALAGELLNRKGCSASRVKRELLQKGIDRELTEQIVEEAEPDPVKKIKELIERKYLRTLGDEKGRRRCIAAMQRLGYRWDDIRTALNQLTDGTADFE